METQATLARRLNAVSYQKAVDDLTKVYGERYTDYRKKFELSGRFEFEPSFPLYLMLEQSYRCNLKCISCIHGYPEVRSKYAMNIPFMPRELFEKVILEGERHNCPSVSMHNNDEPLLLYDLPERIAFAREHGFMDVFLTTNGVLFTEEKIKQVIDAGVTYILFSVDAATEETYSKVRRGGDFKKVLWAIEAVKAYRASRSSNLPIVRASFVINSVNQHEKDRFINNFSELVDFIDIQPFCRFYDMNAAYVPKGVEPTKNFKCNEPWRNMIVRANGDLLPCANFYGCKMVLGNIDKTTIYQTFNSKYVKQLRQEFKNGIYKNHVCLECSKSYYKPQM